MADFPGTVVCEAATTFRLQLAGLDILRFNAARASGEAGTSGQAAVSNLGPQFDFLAANLIADEVVKVDQAPMEMALGILPLLPLALHLWF